MATSKDQDSGNPKGLKPLDEDAVVISGISGVFPNSESVSEFMNNLYNKVDMVSNEPRWELNDLNLPKHLGKVKGMDKFDAQFFKVSYQLASVMEPTSMKLLEHSYGAIFDSGTNLMSLKGKHVGVFVGASFTDSSSMLMYDIYNRSSFVVNGGSKAMLANRISYWVDGKGPSFGLDYACASSAASLEQAYRSIKAGDCNAALVGGCNYCMNPMLSMNMRRAGLLCMDGKTKCFDKNGDGYVRADAVGVFFLQKAKDAKRIYAEVYHAKGLYKMRPDAAFLPLRESEDIEKLLKDFYSETDIDPNNLEYIEGHGSGIAEADANEIDAISKIFAKYGPIKIGSVKSNMGNSESASGICALTKICLAYHTGKLPANLHYSEPIDHVPAISQGKVKVLTEETPFQRGLTAMNNFSYTGANYHILLKGHYKEKNLKKYISEIPRLVLASGRQEESVVKIFELLENQPIDQEQLALLQITFEHDILGHTGRGYAIFDTNENNKTVCLGKAIDYYQGTKRPLWFVYSGMGSQWAGMGTDLMKIPTFAKAIGRCDKVLQPKGINVVKILTEKDNKIFDNVLNAFIGIGAVQIGLTDILKELGIVPDFIIGHSLGEMGCAYHDEAFTSEELILTTYSRAKVCLETPIVKGAMAAIGLRYKDIINQCPPEIDVACHNSSESSTISGPVAAMKEFINDLTKRGIFAKEVECGNIPYHSRYVSVVGQKFLKELRELLKNPKPRSSKWISTSVPQDKWHEDLAKYSSAEYYANNLLSPVLFEEASKLIPDNAIVIEIAPHGLLQAILKRSHKNCTHIPITKRGSPDGIKFLLEAIGKMYQAGLNPKIDTLYPKIEFPVSTETPLLSHFVEWEHSENWPQLSYDVQEPYTASARHFIMSIHDDDFKYLEGHLRDGINVLPEAAVLVHVWETLAMYRNMDYRHLSVIFTDIKFHSEANIRDDIPLKLSIIINKGNNKFEVMQEDKQIASGVVSAAKILRFHHDLHNIEEGDDVIRLTSEDIYKIFQNRGLSYNGQFKSIQSSNLVCNNAKVKWTKEWVTFLDSLIQLNSLARGYDGISAPKFIQRLRINVVEQDKVNLEAMNGVNCCDAQITDIYGITRCAGVEIENIMFDDKSIIEIEPDVLETSQFFSYHTMDKIDLTTALHVIIQIISENATKNSIKLTEIVKSSVSGISNIIRDVLDNTTIDIDLDSVKIENGGTEALITRIQENNKTNIFVIHNLLGDEKELINLQKVISKDTFILAFEESVPKIRTNKKEYFTIITSMSDGKQILVLLKKANVKQDATYIKVDFDNKFTWLPQVYGELRKTKRVVLVSERQPYCGLTGFVRNLRKTVSKNISAVIIDDFYAPKFNPEYSVYNEQLEKYLGINIFKKGVWGNDYYIPSAKLINVKNVTLMNPARGNLDKMAWIEAPPSQASNFLVQVCYAGISMRDTENAVRGVNKYDKSPFGMDFSGIDYSGDRVMGVVNGGALSSTVEADRDLLWPVPEHWSLEDAATVPLPYLHAYYCLTYKVSIREGQSVFVNGGAGAFGQAVISLCLSMNCIVYTTVSNVDKKSFLIRLFPTLDENNIDYSGRDDFHHMILAHTKGKRCDIVINCASGSYREAAMKCVSMSGVFLDISKHDMNENKNVGMHFLAELKNYQTVDLSNLFNLKCESLKKDLHLMIGEGISKGIVRPLTRVIYSLVNVSKAFRLLSTSKHRGRVIIRMRDPAITSEGLSVLPRMTYSSQGVYVVVCDGTGLAVDLADRLVKGGARKVLINLQNSFISSYMQYKFAQWKNKSVTIKFSLDKLCTENGCTAMFRDATIMGEINSVFVLLGTKIKVTESEETQKDFVETFDRTVSAVLNIDSVSRNLSNAISHFVVLSHQSNCDSDEYAVSAIENICEERNKVGLPALILRYDNFYKFQPERNMNEVYKKSQPLLLSTLFETMERSLKLKYKNVYTINLKREAEQNLMTTISKIIGVKSTSQLSEDMVIDDLQLNEINLNEIKTVVKDIYKVDYPIEQIRNMSVKSLIEIDKKATTDNKKSLIGLEAFYSSVDNEEEHIMMSNSVVIAMPTLLNNGTADLDPEGTYLTLIPGFEDRYQVFTSITERLKIQAVAVQLGPDMSNESIPQIAADVRRHMKMKFITKSKFYLLGYSFGVNVALELAELLEKEGHVGVIYCLDSSPDALRVQLDAYLGSFTLNQLQNNVAEHICYLISGEKSEKLTDDLKNIEPWPAKVEYCLKRLKGSVNYSNQYTKSVIETAFKRIILAQSYEPDIKLESELVLIKATPHPKAGALTADYNLSKYTKRPVKVFEIESEHTSAFKDCRVANIVNRLLDPSLLQEFKRRNLCDTYFRQMK